MNALSNVSIRAIPDARDRRTSSQDNCFVLQPRVGRIPLRGNVRPEFERQVFLTGGRHVPAPSRSVDAHVRDQRYGL